MTDDYKIREENIDVMHALDVLQASSAGRNDGGHSPPITSDVNNGPRQPKKQKGSHSVMPSGTKSGSNPSVSPYPPVRYEWEIKE